MTNRPPSPKAKTRSTSALGRITRILRHSVAIALLALPLVGAGPVAARALPTEENSAYCLQMSGWNATELAVTLNCTNAGEGEIYVIYPNGDRRTLVASRVFWEVGTGDPVLYGDTGRIPLTQSGRYTLVLEGKGVDGSLNVIDVFFRKSWELTGREAAPTPTPEATPRPEPTPTPVATPKPDATPKPAVTPEATTTTDDTAALTETEPSTEPSAAPSVLTDDQIAVMTVDETRQTVSTAMTAVGDGVQSLITTIAAAAAGVLALGTLLVVAVVRRRRR
jgi:hypothetical protein